MFNYVLRSKKDNVYYFKAVIGWKVYDCPDHDYTRVISLVRVYTYPFHSPVYANKTIILHYKYGVKVDRTESEWISCRAKDLMASFEGMCNIANACDIRIYRGAWV